MQGEPSVLSGVSILSKAMTDNALYYGDNRDRRRE